MERIPPVRASAAGIDGVSSHPLGSNQDLSGFGRARRPTAPGWEDVPCTGKNPGARHVVFRWVPARAPSSSSLFSCQRPPAARAGRTSGRSAITESAIALFACSRLRITNSDRESQNQIVRSPGRQSPGGGARPETKKGRLVSRAALSGGWSDATSLHPQKGPPGRVLPPARLISPRNFGASAVSNTDWAQA
jgi:hypothetical protein